MSYTFEEELDRSYMLGRLKGALDIAIRALDDATKPDASEWTREFIRDTSLQVLQELQAEVDEADKKVKEELGV